MYDSCDKQFSGDVKWIDEMKVYVVKTNSKIFINGFSPRVKDRYKKEWER